MGWDIKVLSSKSVMTMVRKIALVCCYSGNNTGDRAIVLGTLKFLKQVFPQAEISYHTRYPSRDLNANLEVFRWLSGKYAIFPALIPISRLNPEREIPRALVFFTFIKRLFLLILCYVIGVKGVLFTLDKRTRDAVNDIALAELVVFIGGFFFDGVRCDVRNLINSIIHLYPLLLAKIFKRKVLILGVSMGPFRGTLTRLFLRRALSYTLKIFLREPRSKDFLQEIGVLPEKLAVIPDLAFYLYEGLPRWVDTPSRCESASDTNVIIFVRGPILKRERRQYSLVMANLINYLIEAKNAQVFLVPWTVDVSGWESNDLEIIVEIQRLVAQKNCTKILPFFSSPEKIIQFCRTAALIISSRTHGIVLSRPAPFIAVPVVLTHRFTGLTQLLDLPQYCCKTSTDFSELKNLVDRVLAEKELIRTQQARTLDRLLLNFENLRDELRMLVGD